MAIRSTVTPEAIMVSNFIHSLKISVVAGSCLALVAGCTSVPSQSNANLSLIDTYRVNLAAYELDYKDCARLANQTNTASKMVAGAVAGALVGALIGKSYGVNSNYGARAGIAAGSAAGLGHGELEKQNALRACLRNRGYAVIR